MYAKAFWRCTLPLMKLFLYTRELRNLQLWWHTTRHSWTSQRKRISPGLWNFCDQALQYDIVLAHVRGTKNSAADYLSRIDIGTDERITSNSSTRSQSSSLGWTCHSKPRSKTRKRRLTTWWRHYQLKAERCNQQNSRPSSPRQQRNKWTLFREDWNRPSSVNANPHGPKCQDDVNQIHQQASWQHGEPGMSNGVFQIVQDHLENPDSQRIIRISSENET